LEAKTCAEVLKPYKDHIDLPVFFDFEYDSINNASRHGVTTTKALVMQMTESFCKQIQKAGYKAGFYYNRDFSRRYYDVHKLSYFKWYARYTDTSDQNVSGCDIWQYTSKGRVDGISGNVDTNIIYNKKMIGKGAAAGAGGSGKTTTSTNKKVSDTKMPTIKRESKGQAVKVWQVIVGAEVDGSFGPKTEEATKAFQKKHKLTVDGVVGDKTWKRGLESVK
jgi:peptidoglycan hydrolase-like protein with peptidoglycan-binding domain